jgi:hypothetical protein
MLIHQLLIEVITYYYPLYNIYTLEIENLDFCATFFSFKTTFFSMGSPTCVTVPLPLTKSEVVDCEECEDPIIIYTSYFASDHCSDSLGLRLS